MTQPWHQEETESADAFTAFSAYLAQVPPRRGLLVSLAGMPINPVLLAEWYKAHRWRERAAAWDAHFADIRDAERAALLAQTTREVDAEHMNACASLRQVAITEALKLLEDSKQSPTAKLHPRDLTRLLDVVVKVDRLIRGQVTEIVSQTYDFTKLTDAELEQAEKILSKATQKD